MSNYMFQTSPNGACGVCTESSNTPSVTCTGWTAVEGQNCSITIRADTTNCGGQQGEESEPVVVSFPRPAAPTITGGEVVFDQSQNVSTVTVELEPVDSTTAIAMSDGGDILDGAITDYLASFTIGLSQPVEVICSDTTCTSRELSVHGGGGVFVIALARNAITEGTTSQALCPSFQVLRSIGSSLLDVTLLCPMEAVGGCTIRYGVDPFYQTLPFEGRSGEPLQNLTAGQTYYTEATFSLNCSIGVMFNFTVRDRFETCECPRSALFPGATPDPADTCPPEYTGGVRSGEDGRACYDGLTGGSTAVFLCDTAGADCIGSCQAVCVCQPGDTTGQWSATFESVECVNRRGSGVSTGALAGVVVGVVIVILLVAIIVTIVLCLVYFRTGCLADRSDPGPVYDEVVPAEKFQVEANSAYGPVKRDPGPAYEVVRPAEAFEMEGNAAYRPVRR